MKSVSSILIWKGVGCETLMKKIIIYLIKFYRKYLSPMKTVKCPYCPSCSQYGLEAFERHGVVKGGALTFYRILRCNPFSKGGYDPVPMKTKKHGGYQFGFDAFNKKR